MTDLTQLLHTGDSAHRVDIAIVAEGYTLAERQKFLDDAATFLNSFLGKDNGYLNAPFFSYQGFFNATALFFASAQSGTDQLSNGISVNTYFSSQLYDNGRLLAGDSNLVTQEVAKVLPTNAHELTIVLVNTPLYGGAGGSIAWASAGNSAASELALHEIGHSFAGLQDEYVDVATASDFPLNASAFLQSAHVTDSLSRIPWSDWIGYQDGELGVVDTYLGGYYRSSGVWRATSVSKMLTLGIPFSAPEKEAFALKYYQTIGDYLSVTSSIPGLYQAVTPNNKLFSYSWRVENKVAPTSGQDVFDAFANGDFTSGANLTLTTIDKTGIIRKNLTSTQQVETITEDAHVVQLAHLNYALSAVDSNAILQFDSANNQIEIKDFGQAQHIYIDAGAGMDTLKINASLSDSAHFSISQLASGTLLLGANESLSIAARQFENLQFHDYAVNLHIHANAASINPDDLKGLEDLYVAFFNRIPEANGLDYWITQIKGGMSLKALGDAFYSAAITYSDLTGYNDKMTNADFVNILYKNALGRKEGADAEGLAYWTAQLDSGKESKGSVAHIILGTAHSFKGDVKWGWVADLLDNKLLVADQFAVQWGLSYLTNDDSISNGMKLAALVTPTDTALAISLIGIDADQILFA